jgi:hypothetical protein
MGSHLSVLCLAFTHAASVSHQARAERELEMRVQMAAEQQGLQHRELQTLRQQVSELRVRIGHPHRSASIGSVDSLAVFPCRWRTSSRSSTIGTCSPSWRQLPWPSGRRRPRCVRDDGLHALIFLAPIFLALTPRGMNRPFTLLPPPWSLHLCNSKSSSSSRWGRCSRRARQSSSSSRCSWPVGVHSSWATCPWWGTSLPALSVPEAEADADGGAPPPPLPSGCGISWEWRCVLWQVGWLLLLPGQRPSIAVGHTSRACRATMLAPHQRRWRRPAAPNGDLPHPGPSGLWLPAAVRDGARPGCTLRGYWPSVGPNPPLDRRFGCDNGLVAVEAGRSAACGQGVLYLASVHMDDVFDVMSRCVLQAVGLGRGGVDAS